MVVAESALSTPTRTSNRVTRSVTVLASGPAVSRESYRPIIPARDINAQLGRKPTRELLFAGLRIEPNVSEPRPTTPKFAAKPAAVPPEEPPVAWAVL